MVQVDIVFLHLKVVIYTNTKEKFKCPFRFTSFIFFLISSHRFTYFYFRFLLITPDQNRFDKALKK